jgi:DNA-binding CsgD family transcriptional regulator
MSGDCARALDIALRARELVNSTGSPLDAGCDWVLAQALCVTGKTHEALSLAHHVVHRAFELPAHAAHPLLAYIPGVLHFCEDHAAAHDLAMVGIAQARTHGLLKLLPFALASLALIDHQTGRWPHAHAAASESVDLARELSLETQEGYSLLSLAFVEVGFGREANARRCIDQTLGAAKRFGTESLARGASAALGQLELSLARPDSAIVALEHALMLGRRQHVGQPLVAQYPPDHIEALLQLGRRSDAKRALDEFDAQVQAADSAWGRATAERCRAMLADGDQALNLFERALELHTVTPTPFDRARTELRFGEALRRQRRPSDARVHLRAALDEFERLGAGRWTDQAVAALAAAGERVVAPRERVLARLTPQEMQVCLAVAEGATNREVAARLFLSHKTIETHLSNAYRKIGVRSRTELATLVARHANNGPVSERDPAHAI